MSKDDEQYRKALADDTWATQQRMKNAGAFAPGFGTLLLLALLLMLAALLSGCVSDPLGATTRTQIAAQAQIGVAEQQATAAIAVAQAEGKAAIGVAQAEAKADIAAANARPRVAFWLAGAVAVAALAFAWAHVERGKAQAPKPPQITVIVQAGALPAGREPLTMALPAGRRREAMIVDLERSQ